MATFSSGFYKKLGKAAGAVVIAASLGAVPTIKIWEGRSLTTYYDIAKVLTYCDGETLDAKPGAVYTHEECDAITQRRVLQFAEGVAGKLEVVVPQKVFESHIIFAYNIGVGNYSTSSTLRFTNDGNTAAGCGAMVKFSCITVAAGRGDRTPPDQKLYPGVGCVTKTFNQQFVRGLWNRRDFERKMCLKGAKDVSL